MKIIQYNIFFGQCPNININQRLNNVCNYLLKKNADVICLQEVLKDKYELIKNNTNLAYPYIYPNKCFEHRYDTIIFSRNPFIDSWTKQYDNTNMGRNMKSLTINIRNKEIQIVTSHFESVFRNNAKNKIMQYIWCSDVLNKINKTGVSVILCADTNVCQNSEKEFTKSFDNWKDAWIVSGSDEKSEITYDGEKNNIILANNIDDAVYKSRLDRILYSSDLKCTKFEIIGDEPNEILSDHYGIMATFDDT